MISGIYKLTFKSGRIYIGKSENIEQRWEQHRASFIKRTHSKKMQSEYDAYGAPTYEIILYVHSDHIDIYESIIIRKFWGPKCLNSTKPKPISLEDAEKYLGYYDDLTYRNRSIMLYSTLVHVGMIEQFNSTVDKLNLELGLSQADVEELELRGIKTPEGWHEVNDQLAYINEHLSTENTQLNNKCSRYHSELKRLQKLGWWDRLFNYRVYV